MKYFFLLVFISSMVGCKKFLNEKPDKKLAVPVTIGDGQALLDNFTVINNRDIAAGEISADNYYLTTADWNGITQDYFRRMYIWEKDSLFPSSANDWSNTYAVVYNANTVLECLEKIDRTAANAKEWDNVKGQALFHRARSFLSAAFIWAPAFNAATADRDRGLPLRLTTDFNQPSTRASVSETYKQIIEDLQLAIPLLPPASLHVMRPGKGAAFALLARAYLFLGQYEWAGKYADSCLQIKNALLNFNTLTATASFPVSQFNAEVVFNSSMGNPVPINPGRAKIDSVLYNSYAVNDLRRTIFFRSGGSNTWVFKGSFSGSAILFTGITTAEMLLTRAECAARSGNLAGAANDLNTLLMHRWKTGTFLPFSFTTSALALEKILMERRKELVYRTLRWMDIKRLNKEGYGIILKRVLNGQEYFLLSGDLRYSLPLPEDVVSLSGMEQNPR